MSQITKRALEASLKHLLLQKPLHKITINDITEDCGINRMTFYYHFKDIYDLSNGPVKKTRERHWLETALTTLGSRASYRFFRLYWKINRLS